MVKFGATYTS